MGATLGELISFFSISYTYVCAYVYLLSTVRLFFMHISVYVLKCFQVTPVHLQTSVWVLLRVRYFDFIVSLYVYVFVYMHIYVV